MPTYQYACTDCVHTFDQFQSFTEDALSECPQCRGRLRKLYNAVGVVFKGSGFYRNDSRAPAASDASTPSTKDGGSGKDAGASKDPGPGTTTKTEPKPAAASISSSSSD